MYFVKIRSILGLKRSFWDKGECWERVHWGVNNLSVFNEYWM